MKSTEAISELVGIRTFICSRLPKPTLILVERDKATVCIGSPTWRFPLSIFPGPRPAIWADSNETLANALSDYHKAKDSDAAFCKRAGLTTITAEEIMESISGGSDAT